MSAEREGEYDMLVSSVWLEPKHGPRSKKHEGD